MKLIHVFELLLAVTAAGCVMSAVDTDEPPAEHTGNSAAMVKPAGLDTVPAYFDFDNHYTVADDAAWIYAHFNSYSGKRIMVDLHQRQEAESASVSFTLYKVLLDGRLRFVQTVEGRRGSAITEFRSRGTGSYVIEMVSSGHLADLELNLSCGTGRCSPERQPNESCGGFTRGPVPVCAEGLYCGYLPDDICGWADAPGTCAQKPESCDEALAPVCGCDGATYDNACFAAAKGISVNHLGACLEPGSN